MICGTCSEGLDGSPTTCSACGETPLLDGRYRLDAIVGRGAMGVTYRATRLADGQVVAVKELPFRRIDGAKTKALFAREARVLKQLDHPGIPTYLDDFLSGSGKSTSLCLVQTFVDGQTLKAEMAERRWREDEVLALIADVADVLAYLHELSPPVIHRDIKPGNIMRRVDGSLALIDFGAVRDALDDEKTGGSTVVGTYGFMAPEQFRGDASPASDLYALGATAVTLLSRKTPDTMVDVAGQLDWAPHVDVHPQTQALLNDLLQMDPAQRSQRARTVAQRCRTAAVAVEAARLMPAEQTQRSQAQPAPRRAASPIATPAPRPTALPIAKPVFKPAPRRVPEPEPAFLLATQASRPVATPQQKTIQARRATTTLKITAGVLIAIAVIFFIILFRAPNVVPMVDDAPSKAVDNPPAEPPQPMCGDAPCLPIPRGLKGLTFGMTRAEAIAVLPEIANATEKPKFLGSGLRDMRVVQAAGMPTIGEVLTVSTTLGSLPTTCDLEFIDAGKLTQMTCTVGELATKAAYVAAKDVLSKALTARHGWQASQNLGRPNPYMDAFHHEWTWSDAGATLTLVARYMGLNGRIVHAKSGISLHNSGPAHARVMADGKARVEALRKSQAAKRAQDAERTAREAREALESGRLDTDL